MPKLKTRKAVSKRFTVTSKKKVQKRGANQNHFNAKEASNTKREKRNDVQIKGKMAKNILREMPHA